MRRCIVCTRHDGGVSVCRPSASMIRWMGCGGRWGTPTRGFLDSQLQRSVAAGHGEHAAWRFIQALQWGGCTTSEALEIIRDRDCAHLGTGCELWDEEDVPRDRWFRDAWRRSHNGGPIEIDLEAARPIQAARVEGAVVRENRRRAQVWRRIVLRQPLVEVDWDRLAQRVLEARDEDELRRVWPQELASVR